MLSKSITALQQLLFYVDDTKFLIDFLTEQKVFGPPVFFSFKKYELFERLDYNDPEFMAKLKLLDDEFVEPEPVPVEIVVDPKTAKGKARK